MFLREIGSRCIVISTNPLFFSPSLSARNCLISILLLAFSFQKKNLDLIPFHSPRCFVDTGCHETAHETQTFSCTRFPDLFQLIFHLSQSVTLYPRSLWYFYSSIILHLELEVRFWLDKKQEPIVFDPISRWFVLEINGFVFLMTGNEIFEGSREVSERIDLWRIVDCWIEF